jgi:S-adenosylmethionine-dependent methyltransferase
MLDRARAAIAAAGVTGQVAVVPAGIQELPGVLGGEAFDVVACHAVLEWLADPGAAVAGLAAFLQVGGFLSLMFYNREAALLKRMLSGGPAAAGLAVRPKAGIRIFHDHLRDPALRAEHLDELIAVELAARRREPFASLGQHIHLIATRP